MSLGDDLLPSNTSTPKRVLITGPNGQVGWELKRTAPAGIEIIALDRNLLNICDQNQVNKVLAELTPDVVINTAAYTAVDKAEEEPELAYAVNATGAGYLAKASYELGAHVIHVSTDFVFDGAQAKPYLADDLPNPLGVYGASKLEGEHLVTKYTQGQATIIRTAWVYSSHGNNFVKTMLHLLKERDELKVVADQIGTPTWANSLARTIWKLNDLSDVSGVLHWTDAGVASWYDFAVAIQEEALIAELLEKKIPIIPISSGEYETLAKRPNNSVLNKLETQKALGQRAVHWRESLRFCITEYSHIARA